MKNNENSKKEKIFFFLRHNNDIDHIVPIIYKWLLNEKIETNVIITTKRKHLTDYRINILKKFKHANIVYITDLFKKPSLAYLFNIFYYKFDTKWDKLFKKSKILNKIIDKIIVEIADRIYGDTKNAVVAFDWVTVYFVQQMVKIAQKKKFITVSLPHGDRPYISFFETLNILNYSGLESFKDYKFLDYVAVPNKLCFKRYEPHLEKERIKILGSPRYSDEWLEIISKYIKTYTTKNDKNKLKIVLFLRNINYPIFWDEVVRTIKLILQFPNVYLIVKHHPRNSEAKSLTRKLIKLYPEIKDNINLNLEFIYHAVSSDSVIKWSDIIIDVGTSVTWEPVKKGKPVLMLEYTYANYGTVSYYIKSSEMKSRDDLYNTIEKFTKNKNYKFYNEKERKRFVSEVIDTPDKNVLDNYVNFLKSCYKK